MSWYQNTRRLSQCNLTEIDGRVCDLSVWKQYWKQNHIDGIVVNASGIVSYFRSDDPSQYCSPYLGNRDLFGEFVQAGREAGLSVIARMDCSRTDISLVRLHPDWFSLDSTGYPYSMDGRYFTCVNGDYYKKHIPAQMEEIIRRYHPDAFTDNSWQGLPADRICYCKVCRRQFKEECGMELPRAQDWKDPTYLRWLHWSIECRMRNWRLFNTVTRKHDPDCLWLGMVNADPVSVHCAMYDLHEILQSSPFVMVDHQNRDALNGFEQNIVNGLLLHELGRKLTGIAESMARYARGIYTFRRSAMPGNEAFLWSLCGIAGGLRPWLHIVGAVQEDQRMMSVDRELTEWHHRVEDYLEGGEPVADVGLVWSQQNVLFFGRDNPKKRCALPWRGFTHAMTRAGIPFIPVCAEDIPLDTSRFRVLILPDLAVMTDSQIRRLQTYIEAGGSVFVTGMSGVLDENGNTREDHCVDRMLGVVRDQPRSEPEYGGNWDEYSFHSYIRIEERAHRAFTGMEETSILPFGGWYQPVSEYSERMNVSATLVPAFPYYPPEFAYPREDVTDVPLLLTGMTGYGGRIVYLAADIDRRYGEATLPDHGDLLKNLILWLLEDRMPYTISGNGYLASVMYARENSKLLHIINLSGADLYPGFAENVCPVNSISISIPVEYPGKPITVTSLVSGENLPVSGDQHNWTVMVDRIDKYECLLFDQEGG